MTVHVQELYSSLVKVKARSMSAFTLGLDCREWGELLTSAHQWSLHSGISWRGNVYLTAWMIIRMTLYTVITVARLHTPEHTNTKMHTLWRLPSSSQQWLPPPMLASSMVSSELATRGSVLLVTRASIRQEELQDHCNPLLSPHSVFTQSFFSPLTFENAYKWNRMFDATLLRGSLCVGWTLYCQYCL